MILKPMACRAASGSPGESETSSNRASGGSASRSLRTKASASPSTSMTTVEPLFCTYP